MTNLLNLQLKYACGKKYTAQTDAVKLARE